MDVTELIPHIEALIFASDKPLTSLELTDLINNAFGFMEDKVPLDQIEAAIDGVKEKYASDFYPFEVMVSGGGYQFLTKKEYHKTIAQINGDKFMKRLSAAALETLSIIAYKQPVTKGEIESIRGVSADYAIQKLLEKELVVIAGRNEKLPGHPLVYTTSKTFMDYFGINSADDLPKIKEVLAEQLVVPTNINGEPVLDEEGNPVEGELAVVHDAIVETSIEEAEIAIAVDDVEAETGEEVMVTEEIAAADDTAMAITTEEEQQDDQQHDDAEETA